MAGSGKQATPSRHFRVAIIGAGFSGLVAAAALRKMGIDEITLFERSPSIGGTWWEITNPASEVDTPPHLYSVSFTRYGRTRLHPRQPEILAYLEHVVDVLDLRSRVQLATGIAAVTWSDKRQLQSVITQCGETLEYEAGISAVGFFNTPRLPTWPELSNFDGDMDHSARWPSNTDLRGKDVGAVGTGSAAKQIVAETENASRNVTISPPNPSWVIRKNNRAVTERERAWLRVPLFYRLRRLKHFGAYAACVLAAVTMPRVVPGTPRCTGGCPARC